MRLARRLIASVFVLLVLIISSVWAGVHVGRWLVVEDALAPADVIVVLSGDLPGRAAEAARLYREHYAPRIWISRSVSPAAELKRMHINYLGEEFYNQKVLIAQGVPADAIHVLEEPAFNTLEEVDQIA